MEPTTPDFIWTSDSAAWLTEALDRLNWTYHDLDEALGYGASRGSYTRQVCQTDLVPSEKYRRQLLRWWNNKPQAKAPANLLHQIQTVVVPWLRAREGQRSANQSYTRRRASVAAKRSARR